MLEVGEHAIKEKRVNNLHPPGGQTPVAQEVEQVVY